MCVCERACVPMCARVTYSTEFASRARPLLSSVLLTRPAVLNTTGALYLRTCKCRDTQTSTHSHAMFSLQACVQHGALHWHACIGLSTEHELCMRDSVCACVLQCASDLLNKASQQRAF